MKKYKPITQRDIANVLGLSISTVSRVLNDVYGIGNATKKLVLDYVEKIEYSPNPMALRLKDRRSYSIGVVVPEVANNYYSQVINGIESIAYRRGYHVILSQTHESSQREINNIQQFVSQSVDGILVSLSSETRDMTHFKSLKEKCTPLVFFDRVPRDMDVDKITVNNYQGAYEATEYLIKSGHRKIAHLTSSLNLLINEERLRGYRAALNKYNILFDTDYLFCCESVSDIKSEVEKAVVNFMHLKVRPDAIFSAADKISIECMVALKKNGFKIPDDISLIGFTNISEVEMFESPLTTISQPAFEIGKAAADRLIKQIESKSSCTEPRTSMLATSFNIRSSVKNKLNSFAISNY